MKTYLFAVTLATGVILRCSGVGVDVSEALENACAMLSDEGQMPTDEITDIKAEGVVWP